MDYTTRRLQFCCRCQARRLLASARSLRGRWRRPVFLAERLCSTVFYVLVSFFATGYLGLKNAVLLLGRAAVVYVASEAL